MTRKIMMLFALLVFLLSCSTSQFGWKAEREPAKKEIATSPYAEDFDPNALNDDDINPALDKALLQQSAKQTKTNPSALKQETMASDVIVNGYRVQLLATKDENQANEMKKQAILKLQEKVYLVFEGAFYRIRVGDCVTEKDAKMLRDEAIKKGFTDAWIVPSKVTHRGEAESNL